MKLILESEKISDYLLETKNVDFSHQKIQCKVNELFNKQQTNEEKVERAFAFVRDEVSHTWDIKGSIVTCKASDTLSYGEGICYAKSNLLAALLRAIDIPVGFCYQRLMLFDEPEKGYCIHALNAVYIETIDRWVRLDARGNKPGIAAEFSLDVERLAFSVDVQLDEIDYPTIYKEPYPSTIEALEKHKNPIEMYLKYLPERL